MLGRSLRGLSLRGHGGKKARSLPTLTFSPPFPTHLLYNAPRLVAEHYLTFSWHCRTRLLVYCSLVNTRANHARVGQTLSYQQSQLDIVQIPPRNSPRLGLVSPLGGEAQRLVAVQSKIDADDKYAPCHPSHNQPLFPFSLVPPYRFLSTNY
jgi:hypothetical protein